MNTRDDYDYVITKPGMEEVLYHAGFHKYVDKVMGKNGKWIYKYTKRINSKLKEANRQFLNNVGYPIELETKHQVNKLGKKVNSAIKKVKDKNLYQRTKYKVGQAAGKYSKKQSDYQRIKKYGKNMMVGSKLSYTEDAAIPNTWNYGHDQQDYRFGTGLNGRRKKKTTKNKKSK